MNSSNRTIDSHNRQAGEGQIEGLIHRTYASAAKMQTVDPNAGAPVDRVKHVMLKGEQWIQFVARTGMSAGQARTFSRDEISRFVKNVESHQRAEEPAPILSLYETKPLPQRFLLADTYSDRVV